MHVQAVFSRHGQAKLASSPTEALRKAFSDRGHAKQSGISPTGCVSFLRVPLVWWFGLGNQQEIHRFGGPQEKAPQMLAQHDINPLDS